MSEIPPRPWEQHDYQVWLPNGMFITCPNREVAALVTRLVNAEAPVVDLLRMALNSVQSMPRYEYSYAYIANAKNCIEAAMAKLRGDRPGEGGG